MKLYYSPGACSMAAHIALEEAGRPYDKVKVDLKAHRTEDGEDFYAISKRGYVPALETEYGLVTENPAVLLLLADEADEPPSTEERYRLMEWIGFTGTEVHKSYAPLFKGGSDEEKAQARATVAKKYQLAADLMDGSEWLVGDRPTVADNYLFVTTLWARKMDIEVPDAIAKFRDRNLERESVRKAMTAEGLG